MYVKLLEDDREDDIDMIICDNVKIHEYFLNEIFMRNKGLNPSLAN